MNRWVAGAIAIAGGAAVAIPLTIGIGAGLAGALWIFVFGDNEWPAWVDPAFMTFICAFAVLSWAGIGWTVWLKLRPSPEAG